MCLKRRTVVQWEQLNVVQYFRYIYNFFVQSHLLFIFCFGQRAVALYLPRATISTDPPPKNLLPLCLPQKCILSSSSSTSSCSVPPHVSPQFLGIVQTHTNRTWNTVHVGSWTKLVLGWAGLGWVGLLWLCLAALVYSSPRGGVLRRTPQHNSSVFDVQAVSMSPTPPPPPPPRLK